MHIVVIGGTGTIGQAVVTELTTRHSVTTVSQKHSAITVDITNNHSIEEMYQAIGKVDAVIITAGNVHFGALPQITTEQFKFSLDHKLMGQINLVLSGLQHVNDGGSFTLTSGILNRDPIRFGSCAAMVNGAIDGFVKSAALEMPRGIRINAVSPTILSESMDKYTDYFRGFLPVAASQVALAYSKSVEGGQTGQIYYVG